MAQTGNHNTSDSVPWREADPEFPEAQLIGKALAGAEKAGQTKAADAAKNLETVLARRVRDLRTIRRKQAVLHLARAGADTLGIGGEEWDTGPMSLPVIL